MCCCVGGICLYTHLCCVLCATHSNLPNWVQGLQWTYPQYPCGNIYLDCGAKVRICCLLPLYLEKKMRERKGTMHFPPLLATGECHCGHWQLDYTVWSWWCDRGLRNATAAQNLSGNYSEQSYNKIFQPWRSSSATVKRTSRPSSNSGPTLYHWVSATLVTNPGRDPSSPIAL